MARRAITDAHLALAIRWREQGQPIARIAASLRVSESSVRRALRTEPTTTGLLCHADRDGDCSPPCPQLADGEPASTGRHCPLDVRFNDWNEPDPTDLARRDAYLRASS